jgi:hypothetical protein
MFITIAHTDANNYCTKVQNRAGQPCIRIY